MTTEFFDDEISTEFFQLVHMIQRSAMMNMGMFQDSDGRLHFNLAETKAAIDSLMMLQNKTKGNLSPKEFTMLNGIVSELQLQFTKAPSRQRDLEEQVATQEAIKETFTDPKNAPSELIIDEEE
ncbi:MAG: DUF1844 domain-containing protein [Candidatus Poseidoniaceae archaeon]|jgi:hypothetical protein|nr:DUF1844 domain-containing protein [Candidatus Poseidoniaceae archaeon]